MTKLSRDFEQWRRARRRELIGLGLDAREAYLGAKREALARQGMVPVVGKDAALTSGTVTQLRPDGTYGVFLMAPESKIPPELRSRAEAWAESPPRPQVGSPSN
ncbi:hypothetical protein [Rhizobium leguminosarum]|uniref:hypothetical protein n=1 Tax=Rhizobium leguminosarum TaxID=384 RepID=UPI0013E3767A|nr:hypothetical protein [Rhizobium leguminosarum]